MTTPVSSRSQTPVPVEEPPTSALQSLDISSSDSTQLPTSETSQPLVPLQPTSSSLQNRVRMQQVPKSLLIKCPRIFAQNATGACGVADTPCFSHRGGVSLWMKKGRDVAFMTCAHLFNSASKTYALVYQDQFVFCFQHEPSAEEKKTDLTIVPVGQLCPGGCHVLAPFPPNFPESFHHHL